MLRQNETMSSKERVLKAFAHEKQDRVPINYFSNPGIHKRLLNYFNLGDDETDKMLDILGVDFRGIGARYIGPEYHKQVPNRRVDKFGIHTRWVEHGAGGYWDFCDFPLKNADYETVANWSMPNPDDYDYSNVIEDCKSKSDYAIHVGGAGLGCIMNTAGFLRGMEQTFVDLITDDPAGLLLIDRRLDLDFEITKRVLEKANKYIDFMWMGEDLGTQNAPIIGRNIFDKHILPRHKRFFDLAKAYNLPVMMHCCGSSSWSYEDYIEMGLSAVDTLQPEAKDMSPRYLVDNFGDRLVFHGGISTTNALSFGTTDDVVADVKQTLNIYMETNAYCLSPTHSIQDNTPTENVIAMYETAHKYGRY